MPRTRPPAGWASRWPRRKLWTRWSRHPGRSPRRGSSASAHCRRSCSASSSWSSSSCSRRCSNSYWLQMMIGVVIYSIVTLGLGLLIGRVGMVSLCQFVLAAVGAWVALRLSYATDLPFPVLILIGGCRHRRHRHAHRAARTAALRALPGPHHPHGRRRHHDLPAHRPVPERRRGLLRQLSVGRGHRRSSPARRSPDRRRLLPVLRRRDGAHVRCWRSGRSGASPGARGRPSARARPAPSQPA